MSLSDRGRAALTRRMKEAAGVEVTYTRGATVLTLTAVPGTSAFRSVPDGGVRVEVGERDYQIAVADLAALGVPAVGDRVGETIDGVAMVFEVQTPESGDPAWRYASQWRAMVRVHTKRVP